MMENLYARAGAPGSSDVTGTDEVTAILQMVILYQLMIDLRFFFCDSEFVQAGAIEERSTSGARGFIFQDEGIF